MMKHSHLYDDRRELRRPRWWYLLVGLSLLMMGLVVVRSTPMVQATMVVNSGPCLVYENETWQPITHTDYKVELPVCIRLIGALSPYTPVDESGYVYGQHQGSTWQSQIAVHTVKPDDELQDHRAYTKRLDSEEKWALYAKDWREIGITEATVTIQ